MDDDDIFEELCGCIKVEPDADLDKTLANTVGIADTNKKTKPPCDVSADTSRKNVVVSKCVQQHYTKVACALETSKVEHYHDLCMEDIENSDSNKENESVIVPQAKAWDYDCLEKDLALVVVAIKSSECDEKIHEMLLDTREKLFVSLQQDDLHMLQEKYNQQANFGRKIASGRVPWRRGKSQQGKPFGCRSCKFLGIRKFDLMVHIVENHAEVAVEKKLPPIQCLVPGNDPESVWFRCMECTFVTSFKSSWFCHLITHKSMDEVETFSCNQCSYVTKRQYSLKKHLAFHQAWSASKFHKCPHCSFKTIHRRYMDTHIRMLHEADKVKRFSCRRCTFQTKYYTSYQKHLNVHKAHRKMYKCDLCPFQTAHLVTLKYSHHLTHKADESTQLFSCAQCSFETKRKDSLVSHVQIHRSPDEVKMWKCGICPYKTRHKYTLKDHRMTHETPDEDNLLPCKLCPYQAKSDKHMRQHIKRKHLPPEKCKFYKCEECSYRSKCSSNVVRHSLTHRRPEELDYFKCHLCDYQGTTKEKMSAHHKNVHLNPKAVNWFRCKVCDFKSRQKGNLLRHMQTHEHPDRDRMIAESRKCKDCDFSAKTKAELLVHSLKYRHNNIKCDQCKYKTPYKTNLAKHKRNKH